MYARLRRGFRGISSYLSFVFALAERKNERQSKGKVPL
jgi:hypothetical protein